MAFVLVVLTCYPLLNMFGGIGAAWLSLTVESFILCALLLFAFVNIVRTTASGHQQIAVRK